MRAALLCCVVVALALTVVAAAPSRPSFPSAYRATFSNLLVFTSDFNLTTTNGLVAVSQALQAYKQSGIIYGVNATTLNLYQKHVSYVWTARSCSKKPLSNTFQGADPLQMILYTSFAGAVRVNNVQTQVWLFENANRDVRVAIYVTDNARQTPVRLFLETYGVGVQIDYTSFTTGASASDFQTPKACSTTARQPLEQEQEEGRVHAVAASVATKRSSLSDSLEAEPHASGLAAVHAVLASMQLP